MSVALTKKPLRKYISASPLGEGLVFYLQELREDHLRKIQSQYRILKSPLNFLRQAFAQGVFLFSHGDSVFLWPDDYHKQDALFVNIPESVVIEVGLSSLGWHRRDHESSLEFINRALDQLVSSD